MSRPGCMALAAVSLALGLTACGEKKNDKKVGKTTSQSAATTAATGASTGRPAPARCRAVAAPKPKSAKASKVPRPTAKLDPKAVSDVVLSTSCGDITIRLDVKRAPKTTASFANLVRRRFYDKLIFHRISPGFVIQGGDPEGTGQGGPGYKVVEAPPQDLSYTKYVVAMAKTEIEDPGTSGSQFFIVTVDDSGLDPQYALVGRVVAGKDVVDLVGTAQIDPATERPVKPIVIESAKLETKKLPVKPKKK